MNQFPKILVIGATGYLGLHIIQQLQMRNSNFKALARNRRKLLELGVEEESIIEAEVTEPDTLTGVCENIDIVISCLGITRQRDGLSYSDVDYQGNINVLIEAERAGVEKFIYISAFNAEKHRDVRMLQAKEKFSSRLLCSTKLTPCVIRPNGFFVDMEEIYHMASKGRAYLFGPKPMSMNPIHGKDLAEFCLAAIDSDKREIDVGGPETLSMMQIAQLAFDAQHKQSAITLLPDAIRRVVLWIMNKLPEKWGGPAEFFLTAMGEDSIAPHYGVQKLGDHYKRIHDKQLHDKQLHDKQTHNI